MLHPEFESPFKHQESKLWDFVALFDETAHRPPDWRYRIAQLYRYYSHQGKQKSDNSAVKYLKKYIKKKKDDYLHQLIDFYTYLDKGLSQEPPVPFVILTAELSEKYPLLSSVISRVYSQEGKESVFDSKCLILARQPDEIVKTARFSAEQLDCFRKCFFDLGEPELNNIYYIVHYVVFPTAEYNFVDRHALSLFFCYTNGYDAFRYLRLRSGLSDYNFLNNTVEPNNPKALGNAIRWQAHLVLESVKDMNDFLTVVRTIKDFVMDKDYDKSANEDVMAQLYETLRFQLKVKEDPKLISGDPKFVEENRAIYEERENQIIIK